MKFPIANNILIETNSKIISIEFIETSDDVLKDSELFSVGKKIEKDYFRLVTTELEIIIHNSKWVIPYQYIYSKITENQFSIDTPNKLSFYRKRIRNIPLFEIEKKEHYILLLLLLIDIESISDKVINDKEFNIITVNDFISNDDVNEICDFDKEYELRLYKSIPKPELFSFTAEKLTEGKGHINGINYSWSIPCINISDLNFPYEKMYDAGKYESGNPKMLEFFGPFSINLVPKSFFSRYFKKIETVNEFWTFASSYQKMFPHQSLYKGSYSNYHYSLFKGSYSDCLKIFNDEEKLLELTHKLNHELHELFDKNNPPSHPGDYTEKDSFYAMTDGQLGDYDDFSGSMDDIDTWARG